MSAAARAELNIAPRDPLCPWRYASHLGVTVLDFAALDIAAGHARQLTVIDERSWSGLTLKEAGITAVVLNPSHPQTRQSSTLMHELAHHILLHPPTRVDVSATGMMLLSEYSDEQEAEADWLAAALLLPREALIALRAGGSTTEEICERYGISSELCEWRIRMTGVDRQIRFSRGN